jgi:hypothetical protein
MRETHTNFGFVPNITISIHLNARHVLGETPTGVYFTHFTNKQFHDLMTKKSIPAAAATVLGLRLKFIPVPKKSIRLDDINEALKRFNRDFYLNVHFTDDDADSDSEEPIEKLQVNSKWMPDQPLFDITQRLSNFEGAITRNFQPWCRKSNLSKFQAKILHQIGNNKDIIIVHADKNLGPVDLDTETYIRWALDEHLTDANTYVQVSEQEAQTSATKLYLTIYKRTRENRMCSSLTKDATTYIRHWTLKNRSNPFGYFYLMIKIHKAKGGTHPVCSNCASLIHPLRKWLDYTLQPVVTSQPFYFKDSFTLKQELDKLVLPPNASIISFDAISMYTNIYINDSIKRTSTFLAKTWDNYDCKAVKEAINRDEK